MPILYEIDVSRRLVRTTCAGAVTFDQAMAHFAALERDPRRASPMDIMLDLRTITTTPETSQLRGVADRIAPGNTPLRWGRLAIVAVTPEAVGIGRLFAEFARGRFIDTTIVETIAHAERWLQAADLARAESA